MNTGPAIRGQIQISLLANVVNSKGAADRKATHLVADNLHPRIQHFLDPRHVKVGHTDVRYLAVCLAVRQVPSRVHVARSAVVLPVELHVVDSLDAQAAPGNVNSLRSDPFIRIYVASIHCVEPVPGSITPSILHTTK